jgi:hypothetical protein
MELIKKYRFIIAGILVLVALIILRNSGTGHFRYDARKWAEPSFSGANIIDRHDINFLPGEELLVFLTPDLGSTLIFEGPALSIPFDSILTKRYRHVIGRHSGSVVLYSSDISVSARTWMALSQSGFKDIFVLDPDGNEELANKKFRTDTLASPEL